jgi:hypothetical protein
VGWDKGRYYTRSRKVNGRVVREYIGGGEAGKLVAQLDAINRQDRELARETMRTLRAELDALAARLDELNGLTDLLARAALVAAGFRQHKRGEWGKKRDNCKGAQCARQALADRPEGAKEGAGPRPAR